MVRRSLRRAVGKREASGFKPESQDRSNRTLMATVVRKKKIPLGSPLYERGFAQDRANLQTILARYRKAGIPVCIGTVVSNERDHRPVISGHGEGVDAAARRLHFASGIVSEEIMLEHLHPNLRGY